jgi:hypothetical protein
MILLRMVTFFNISETIHNLGTVYAITKLFVMRVITFVKSESKKVYEKI